MPVFQPLHTLLEDLSDPEAPVNSVLPRGVAVAIRDGDGRLLFSGSGGRDLTSDDIGWVASCSKLITPIAILQLFEQDRLELDQAIEPLLPHLDLSRVLQGFDGSGQPILQPTLAKVTLRQLCDHTSGVGYTWIHRDLARYQGVEPDAVPTTTAGYNSPRTRRSINNRLRQVDGPLIHQPGTAFDYSPGLGVASALVERLTGQSFEDYLQEHICNPLGLKKTSFIAASDSFSTIHRRTDASKPWTLQPNPYYKAASYRGDAGLYSTAKDLSLLLSHVLGALQGKATPLFKDPATAKLLWEVKSFDASKKTALVDFLRMFWGIRSAEIRDRLPEADWAFGLGYLVNRQTSPCGRKAGSGGWEGSSGPAAWIDPVSNICVTVMMQTVPIMDEAPQRAHAAIEAKIYACLSAS